MIGDMKSKIIIRKTAQMKINRQSTIINPKGDDKINKKLSVLIVDDDVDLGDSLLDILEAKGYDVTYVSSGNKAISKIEEKKYDVIFMDIRMPGMNGVETFRRVKELSPLSSVVMITAYAEDDLVDQAREEGSLQILSKPLDINKIIGFLKKQELLKTIFIVDDDYEFCSSLEDAISLHGYDVTVVHGAQEAIDTFKNNEYGIVLLDIKLNGRNGLEVAESIEEKGYKCLVVMMSAYKKEFQDLLDKTDIKNSFIEKPFEIGTLVKLLTEMSRKRLTKVLT